MDSISAPQITLSSKENKVAGVPLTQLEHFKAELKRQLQRTQEFCTLPYRNFHTPFLPWYQCRAHVSHTLP